MKFNPTKENLKCVRKFYTQAAEGKFFAAAESLDVNVEWKEPEMPGVWFSGTRRGSEAVRKEVLEPMPDKFDHYQVKMKKFFPVGNYVIALGHIRGQHKVTGQKLNLATAHIWTLRAGKAVRFEAYHDEAGWAAMVPETAPGESRLAA